MSKYSIHDDTGLSNDDGPFRSYELIAAGDTLAELLDDACIFAIDQDGGERGQTPLFSLGNGELWRTCMAMIESEIAKTARGA